MKFPGGLKMRVDVSLCGSIPRSEMQCSKSDRLEKNSHDNRKSLSIKSIQPIQVLSSKQPNIVSDKSDSETKPLEPPSWAVPARGEARLEPVCDSTNTQTPVDLTTKTCIRFGRSQSSDVILHHCNSSRRHAMLFHHPNGNCYVVDCGSVHGTYVNGSRVRSLVLQEKSGNSGCKQSSRVIPYRVKKGALIRFGGPGAPTFVLKSFSLGFEELVKDLTRPDVVTCDGRNIVEDEASSEKAPELSPAALVTLNTRINSMSRRYMNSFPGTSIAMASAKLLMPKNSAPTPQHVKKRSRDSSGFGSFDEKEPVKKKPMITVETLNTGSSTDLAIISPVPTEELIDFSHIDRPIVSPNPLDSFANANDSCNELRNSLKDFFVLPPLTLPTKKKKSVKFSEEPPQLFYPQSSFTSDEASPCEDE